MKGNDKNKNVPEHFRNDNWFLRTISIFSQKKVSTCRTLFGHNTCGFLASNDTQFCPSASRIYSLWPKLQENVPDLNISMYFVGVIVSSTIEYMEVSLEHSLHTGLKSSLC